MRALRFLCFASLVAVLASCGIKGPLYLPDTRPAPDGKAGHEPADHNNKLRQDAPQ
ncbi:LPS translocon maturation chaperone LptM [Cognatazoarcus halotolerans]|uniref:LPS translocon maturation chaperone LptM n=1 Tax=Cognatazoarcus halotolerans TaxID=2686016 RepID=UPI0013587076|nr:lipoprotein [Cognatazoarcus halotolerans]MCB1902323.1 lipoprotein [Rhodocyclaceae bacterium]MCP5310890.1 lipoprotein [Zoogloeaceae bacterium]